MNNTTNARKVWFLERIGKRVYRNNVSCTCSSCMHSYQEGLIIVDEQYAGYLYNLECDYAADGDLITYFDTPEEVLELELKIMDGSHIKFGRWLLKYADSVDSGDGLCWKYEGRKYNTDELYLEYKTLENLTKEDLQYEMIKPVPNNKFKFNFRMSVKELIDRYENQMTPEQVEKLKNYKPTS